jgi:hypothetical protein
MRKEVEMTAKEFMRGVDRLKHSPWEDRMLGVLRRLGGAPVPSRRCGLAMGWKKQPTDSANLQFGRLAGRLCDCVPVKRPKYCVKAIFDIGDDPRWKVWPHILKALNNI